MKTLNHNDREFPVAHFQGNTFNTFALTLGRAFVGRKIIIPNDVTIVTVATKNIIDNSPLISQLNRNSINFINTATETNANISGWKNTDKPGFILSGLEQVKTKYALVLDAADVLLTGDLKDIVERFNEYGKDVLFGATKSNYPDVLIDKVEKRDWLGEFRYLNAGTAFGLTNALKKFYTAVVNLNIENPFDSEQFLVRHIFANNQDWVGFDYKCGIFQTFGKATVFHPDKKDITVAKVI